MNADEKAKLRARDVWGAVALISASLFFLWRTSYIPLFGGNRAGVSDAAWYNSAAIVPLGIWSAMLVLGVGLLIASLKEAGRAALTAAGLGWNIAEIRRVGAIAVILLFYIFGLAPRVDFIIASGLLITALIYGYHDGIAGRMMLSAAAVALAGGYALIAHFPQSQWNKPHDDDWAALTIWVLLTLWMLRHGEGRVIRAVPYVAALLPFALVCAMAFGFRQNVPNRGGLLFSQIEYQYYVTVKPLWAR